MRLVAQRVSRASVTIDGQIVSSIERGLLVLVGVCDEDTSDDVEYLAAKLSKLRIFNDDQGVMNLDVMEVGGEILVVSQFTLFASTKKGNRPSYIRAAKGDFAKELYEQFACRVSELVGCPLKTGHFGADMKVELLNDGPVTILMDSKQRDY